MELSLLDRWLLGTLLGGGLFLLLVHLLAERMTQPARRIRWSEYGVLAALVLSLASLAPAWLIVPVPANGVRSEPAAPPVSARVEPFPEEEPELPWIAVEPVESAEVLPKPVLPVEAEPVVSVVEPWDWFNPARNGLAVIYGLGALLFLGRWLLGIVGLQRLLGACRPVADWVQQAAERRLPGVRVLCSPRVEVPFSCGIMRPTIVLPVGLAEQASGEHLAWVLAHEAAHLRRGDPRSSSLFGLASVLFYPFPWFWGLRARRRLDQEYLADAEAVELAPRVEYAEFLLQWSTRPSARRVPAGAVGVLGRSSDLFRRITMLLRGNPSLESRCPRLWSAVVGPALLGFAILAAGLGFEAAAAPVPEPEKKVEPLPAPKNEEKPKVPAAPAAPNFPNFPEFPDFPDIDKLLPPNLPLDPAQLKQLQDEMKRAREEMKKAMEDLQKQIPGGFPGGFPGGLPGNIQIVPGGIQIQPIQIQPGRINLLNRNRTDSRFGAVLTKPSETLVEQLDLPKNQGLVIEKIEDGSASAKAGIKAHDVLLELAGKPVSDNLADLAAQLKEIKPDQAVEAVVLRKGKKETIKNLTLPEAKPMIRNPIQRVPFNFPNVFPNIPGGANTNLTVVRNGDNFTTQFSENGVEMSLTGTVTEGKGTLSEVSITENGATTKYTDLEKVPETHRARVKELVEMSATGKVKFNR